MRVAVRVDGSRQVGTGHVFRTLALAQALRRRGASVHFLTRDFPFGGAADIEAAGFETVRLSVEAANAGSWLGASVEHEVQEVVAALDRSEPFDWLVLDHYGLDESWERAIRPLVGRVFVIDDLADRRHDCDVLLDATPLREGAPDRYAELIPPSTTRLYGPGYALLREEFTRRKRHVRTEGVRRILVFLGGADEADVTSRAMEALSAGEITEGIPVDVVLGSAYRDPAAFAARWNRRATVHATSNDMAGLISGSDLAIGAAGTSSWERAWLGLPTVAVAIADNQREVAAALAEAGAVVYAGWHADVDADALAACIRPFVEDKALLAQMSMRAIRIMGAESTPATDRAARFMLTEPS